MNDIDRVLSLYNQIEDRRMAGLSVSPALESEYRRLKTAVYSEIAATTNEEPIRVVALKWAQERQVEL
jgi:hypothetical protein